MATRIPTPRKRYDEENFVLPHKNTCTQKRIGAGAEINPADKDLRSQVDFANTSQQLIFTVTFNYPDLVKDATFTLFNIGNKNTEFQDQIRSIIATDGTNQYAANISNLGSSVQLAGTGTSQTLTGIATTANNTGTGNATIDFGSNKINQISFVYGSGPSTISNPKAQQIALFDISFASAVPEVGAGFAAVTACLLVIVTARRRSPRFREIRPTAALPLRIAGCER
jgi:hypothetical protein